MRRCFQLASGLLLLGSITAWAVLGANRGWTKTSVPIHSVDEVTGLVGVSYREQFVPGVEILGGAFLVSLLLFGLSFLMKKSTT